jgi:hypothetical protein
MNKYEIAVIIGLWRQGNNDAVIAAIMNITRIEVEQTVADYLKNI